VHATCQTLMRYAPTSHQLFAVGFTINYSAIIFYAFIANDLHWHWVRDVSCPEHKCLGYINFMATIIFIIGHAGRPSISHAIVTGFKQLIYGCAGKQWGAGRCRGGRQVEACDHVTQTARQRAFERASFLACCSPCVLLMYDRIHSSLSRARLRVVLFSAGRRHQSRSRKRNSNPMPSVAVRCVSSAL
jgi:hypothetical protein